MTRERDYSIDVIKCLATILITHSHLEPLLGKFAFIATGGSFGDSLFFFCSGYTLALSQYQGNFLNWYKRRISRIYPTIFTWALLCAIIFNTNRNMLSIIESGGGFFVSCIMIFYAVFYFLKQPIVNHFTWSNIGFIAISFLSLILINHNDVDAMYKWTWSLYFLPMILGAMLGRMRSNNIIIGRISPAKCLLLFTASVVLYFALSYISSFSAIMFYVKPLIILPQLGFCYSLYLICNLEYIHRIYLKKSFYYAIMFTGSICLEVYLVQPVLIHRFAFPQYFPINVPLIYLIIFTCAYVLKCLSKIWEQTFDKQNYDFKKIIHLPPLKH